MPVSRTLGRTGKLFGWLIPGAKQGGCYQLCHKQECTDTEKTHKV